MFQIQKIINPYKDFVMVGLKYSEFDDGFRVLFAIRGVVDWIVFEYAKFGILILFLLSESEYGFI